MLTNEQERELIEWQLGRGIVNLDYVGEYCPWDYPAVLVVKPFVENNNTVSPTIFWLSCPYLVYKVDRLENEGLIEELTFKLKHNLEFEDKMLSAHRKYAEMRRDKLSDNDLKAAEKISEDLMNTLKKSGIGGIKDKSGIKCLHTHLADYLMGNDNPAAELVWTKITWPKNCSICRERIDDIESGSH
ncbi:MULTISPECIES: DUF501 domain-containing protein [unclassified Halanaerobium]|uniref:DUF501 domain-containing protein n=1 Tax=unclassified Halanaerobium TaxID=2641197 RepID=UPI000DF1F1DB|nr:MULTISPECIES: DUF501 domain-containing protein [unclassified Halanaerobium]RCW41165.1 hypothetical protein DFR78_1388 [Halanaerobium sp. MA284_MarDTE_T2]RCW79601.1 hypothetical protein DER71_1378 [Halanaerobium sp. DL-01]